MYAGAKAKEIIDSRFSSMQKYTTRPHRLFPFQQTWPVQKGSIMEHFHKVEADWKGGRGRKHGMNKRAQRENTPGLSSGKFTIDLYGKQVRWVMGPQISPRRWRKRAQPLDYFQPARQIRAQGKSLQLEGENTRKKIGLMHGGIEILYPGKKIEALLLPDPAPPPLG